MKPRTHRSLVNSDWGVYVNGFQRFHSPSFLACCCYCHLTKLGVLIMNAKVAHA